MTSIWIAVAAVVSAVAALAGLRCMDRRHDEAVWRDLIEQAGPSPGFFDPASVRELPEPARRYFEYTIAAGAPLVPAVELTMHGELALGSKDRPRYAPMRARQILAPPHGLVWRVEAGALSGSDGATHGESWTRFWLFGVVPVVRLGGDEDHHRSAFGRVVAEAAFWAPAMLLPNEYVRWEALDDNRVRATVSYAGFEQELTLTIAEDGQPTSVVIPRWSDENPSREYRLQPFGGSLREFRRFGGYRLPTIVEGGNHFGTPEYFPFYRAVMDDVRLLVESP